MIAAAAEAQAEWGRLSGSERADVLAQAASILRAENDSMAELEALDTARPLAETEVVDIASAYECLDWCAAEARRLSGYTMALPNNHHGWTRRLPLGVTAGIGAFNYPLQSAVFKSAPALAAGNAMLFKPADDTVLTALQLQRVYLEAGVPEGLFNVVLGGAAVGQHLAGHPDIGKISFTGSHATGMRVKQAAGATLKEVTLEMGGKSPLVVFADADLENAVSGALLANFFSNGQVCSNGTRVFVHADIISDFAERLVERTRRLVLGDPLDPSTDVGPLINARQHAKVLAYLEQARAEGCRVLCGGGRPEAAGPTATGFFVAPTVLADCTDDMSVVCEEIFGPVLSLLAFEDEAEAVQRANATPYGLAAGLFTSDLNRAHRVAAALRAGAVYINTFNLAPVQLPWGGLKASGTVGRENGLGVLDAWTAQQFFIRDANPTLDCPYA